MVDRRHGRSGLGHANAPSSFALHSCSFALLSSLLLMLMFIPSWPSIHVPASTILTPHSRSFALHSYRTLLLMFTPYLPHIRAHVHPVLALCPCSIFVSYSISYSLLFEPPSVHIFISYSSFLFVHSYYSFHIFSYSLPLFIIPASLSCVCFFPNPSCISSAACGSSLFGCALLTHLHPHYLFMLTHFSSYFRFYCQALSFSFYLI